MQSQPRWLQYLGADLAATASEIEALLRSRLDDQAAANIAAHQGLTTPVLQELLLEAVDRACSRSVGIILRKSPNIDPNEWRVSWSVVSDRTTLHRAMSRR